MAGPEMAQKLVKDRSQFLEYLRDDLRRHSELLAVNNGVLKSLEAVQENVRLLAEKPRHEALVPLTKNLFVNATIKYTGEYLVEHQAQPNSYHVLLTAKDTDSFLERKIGAQKGAIDTLEKTCEQLEERLKLLDLNSNDGMGEDQTIVSDRGVAIKMGEFYEILEYEP